MNTKQKKFDIDRELNVVVSDIPFPSAVVSALVESYKSGTRIELEYVLNDDMRDLNAFMDQLSKISSLSISWLTPQRDRTVAIMTYEDLEFQGHQFEFDTTESESQYFLVAFEMLPKLVIPSDSVSN